MGLDMAHVAKNKIEKLVYVIFGYEDYLMKYGKC